MFCLVQNDTVVERKELTDEQLQAATPQYQYIFDVTNMNPMPDVGWVMSGNKLVPGQNMTATPTLKISKLSLLNRFTNTELATYYTAIQSNVGLLILDKKLFAAEYIDLARADVIYGINDLAAAGIITSARATQILTTPITEVERYKGQQ